MTAVATVAGDEVCVLTAARAWAAPVGIRALEAGVRVMARPDGATVAFVSGTCDASSLPPGAPLVWLVPERGPSQPELAHLRSLCAGLARDAEPWILVCFEPDGGLPSESEVATIERSVQRALRCDQSFRLGVVERSRRDVQPSLATFLRELAEGPR